MKTRRCIDFESLELHLFMPSLAVLAIAVSWIGLCMLMFSIVNQSWEKEIPLRLHASGSSEKLPNRAQSPEIVIRADDRLEWEGQILSDGSSRSLTDLKKKILAHFLKPEAVKVVVWVEAEARYARMVEVQNTFMACQCTRHHMVVLPPLVGPRRPISTDLMPARP
jgi:biopolymer transport protein ExbD